MTNKYIKQYLTIFIFLITGIVNTQIYAAAECTEITKQLYNAIETEDLKRIDALLKENTSSLDPASLAQNIEFRTLTAHATKKGKLKSLQHLHEKYGLPIITINQDKATLLMMAARHGHPDIIKYLIKKAPILLNMTNAYGANARTYALHANLKDIDRLLRTKGVEKGIDPKIAIANMKKPKPLSLAEQLDAYTAPSMQTTKSQIIVDQLYQATINGDIDGIAAIFAYHDAQDPSFSTAILASSGHQMAVHAVMQNRVNVLSFLHEQHGVSLDTADEHGITLLMHAANMGYRETIQYLLSKESPATIKKVDAFGADALAYAKENQTIIDLLIQGGAQAKENPILTKIKTFSFAPNMIEKHKSFINMQDPTTGETPLMVAAIQATSNKATSIQKNKAKILLLALLKNGADPLVATKEGITVFNFISTNSNLTESIVQITDKSKYTDLLREACKSNNIILLKTLKKYARSLSLSDTLNRTNITPLAAAAAYESIDVLNYLLDQGVDPKIKVMDNRTPLGIASANGHEAIVELLLSKNVLVNDTCNQFGQTALMQAVIRNKPEVVSCLLAHGANIDITDSEGKTALDHATDNKTIHDILTKKKTFEEAERRKIPQLLTRKLAEDTSHDQSDDARMLLEKAAHTGVTPSVLSFIEQETHKIETKKKQQAKQSKKAAALQSENITRSLLNSGFVDVDAIRNPKIYVQGKLRMSKKHGAHTAVTNLIALDKAEQEREEQEKEAELAAAQVAPLQQKSVKQPAELDVSGLPSYPMRPPKADGTLRLFSEEELLAKFKWDNIQFAKVKSLLDYKAQQAQLTIDNLKKAREFYEKSCDCQQQLERINNNPTEQKRLNDTGTLFYNQTLEHHARAQYHYQQEQDTDTYISNRARASLDQQRQQAEIDTYMESIMPSFSPKKQMALRKEWAIQKKQDLDRRNFMQEFEKRMWQESAPQSVASSIQ